MVGLGSSFHFYRTDCPQVSDSINTFSVHSYKRIAMQWGLGLPPPKAAILGKEQTEWVYHLGGTSDWLRQWGPIYVTYISQVRPTPSQSVTQIPFPCQTSCFAFCSLPFLLLCCLSPLQSDACHRQALVTCGMCPTSCHPWAKR